MRGKFGRYNQPVRCQGCGKLTREDVGGGTQLCKRCYDEAGLENEHQDGYHDKEPNKDCPMCKEAVL